MHPLMKRNYKPLDRRASKAYTLARKSINNRSIKYRTDDDNLENIDEYWMDNHSEEEIDMSLLKSQKKTFKKSFDKEYTMELNTIDLSGVSDSIYEEINNGDINEIFPNSSGSVQLEEVKDASAEDVNDKHDDENVSEAEYVSVKEYISEEEDVNQDSDLSINEQVSDASINEEHSDDGANELDNNEASDDSNETNRSSNDDSNRSLESQKDEESNNSFHIKKSANKAVMDRNNMKRRSTVACMNSYILEAFIDKKPKKIQKKKLEKVFHNKEMIAVNNLTKTGFKKSESLEIFQRDNFYSQIFYLKGGAILEDKSSKCSISVCVLKGRIKIDMKEKEIILKSLGVCLIDCRYKIECLSTNGAVLYFVNVLN